MAWRSAPHRSQKRSFVEMRFSQIGHRIICGCADRIVLLWSVYGNVLCDGLRHCTRDGRFGTNRVRYSRSLECANR